MEDMQHKMLDAAGIEIQRPDRYDEAKTLAMQNALQEIKVLRQLIFNVFNESGNFCGMNRHDQALVAAIVQEFSNPQ